MAWRNIISNVLPFFGGESQSVLPMAVGRGTLNGREPGDSRMHWLYTWETRDKMMPARTRFARTLGHIQFTNVAGHSWCNSGYGDAMTLAISQLMKSEVAVMLNNAAASIDNKSGGLLWDEAQGRFVSDPPKASSNPLKTNSDPTAKNQRPGTQQGNTTIGRLNTGGVYNTGGGGHNTGNASSGRYNGGTGGYATGGYATGGGSFSIGGGSNN
ncbi:hypothetical protein GNI_043460, partial [Gregarina niphandrodes]